MFHGLRQRFEGLRRRVISRVDAAHGGAVGQHDDGVARTHVAVDGATVEAATHGAHEQLLQLSGGHGGVRRYHRE
ncbi:uncharacterized protein METZ01_LOCUS211037, partial [marine metagenome]